MRIPARCLALIPVAILATVSLRGQTELPDGEGKVLLQKKCGSCHGLYKTTDDNKSEAEWGDVVYKMTGLGVQLTDEEFDTLVKYLTKNFGPKDKK